METIITHNNRNYLLDTKKDQITFLDARFYKTEEGIFIPSVTTILEAYPKGPEYYAWLKKVGEDSDEIRDEAGRRGSRVHSLTEQYDAGHEIRLVDDNGNINMKLNEWSMLEKYVEFRGRYPFEIIMSEQTIISEEFGMAGTLDRVIDLNGRKMLVDIKTSNAIYSSYWLQLAAYKKMLLAIGVEVDEVAILWLNAKTRSNGKDGQIQGTGWQLLTAKQAGRDENKDWELFKATQNLWTAENGELKPRQTSYKLSYQLKAVDQIQTV